MNSSGKVRDNRPIIIARECSTDLRPSKGFLVGLAIVSQTMYANTMDHLDDFATLKAMGASDSTIRWFVLSQSVLIGLAGGLLGLLLTWPLTSLARQGLVSWIDTRWWLAAGGVAAGLAMCVVASLASVGRAVRVDPAEALRS
jgi:putative ABC transport system permease protein